MIVWLTTRERCNEIALELETFGRLSQREIERELRRTAASLSVPEPG